MRSAVRSTLKEPAVADVPHRVWRDWLIAGVLVPAAALEITFREAAGWKPGAMVISVVLAVAVFWRRTHPLATTAIVFGSIIGLDYVSRFFVGRPLEFYFSAIVLIIPYALFRWGSGRDALIGLGILLVSLVHFNVVGWTGFGDAIGGLLVLLFPAALGYIVRFRNRSRAQGIEEVKLRERAQLARELHDTVAHHVSAIAIQAQAGRAVGATQPEVALEILATIEEEASRTLFEMRSMVGALRSGDEAVLAPGSGVDDIDRLARSSARLPITVERKGSLGGLSDSLDRALFRLARESITNANRHARNATGVSVTLDGDRDSVRLDVIDDGDLRSFDSNADRGFGLVGMAERASLLGGTLEAGPNPRRGWTVTAVLPKGGRGS